MKTVLPFLSNLNGKHFVKSLMGRISLVAAGTIVGLLICEDPYAGWTGYPNVDVRFRRPGSFDVRVTQNSRGLRDSEKSLAASPGIRRIVVLGDSFAWGTGVENGEIFSRILQELIPDSETINLGVRGYGTVQQLVRLETECLLYEPDLPVLVFYWNDLEDNFDDKGGARPISAIEDSDTLRIANRLARKPLAAPLAQLLRRHSGLFRFVDYTLQHAKRRLKLKQNQRRRVLMAGQRSALASSANDANIDMMQFSAAEVYGPPCPEVDLAWKAMYLLLARIKELAGKKGGNLVVVYATPAEVVDKKLFAEAIRVVGLDPQSANCDWDRPSKRLGELCGRLGIPYVDLTPIFRRHPQPVSLFLKRNAHWSAAGHRLAAEEVAAKIKTLN
ncbi:MAG: SGNH/GDSL hydrolase family protein [Candidatus Lindowbacteria bacterium]|nr:SGNH/GDSL hydrolase family protein [Candidatus Lindowbacteria bacterium]